MHRISNGTQINAVPGIPAVIGLPGYYTAGVPGVQAATAIDATQLNAIQEELAAVVEHAGIVLDKTNNAQLLAALNALFAGASGLAAEIAAREAEDSTLNTNLGAESTTRANADAAEALARSNEDAVLNAAIAAETNARAAADQVVAANAAAAATAAGNNAVADVLGQFTQAFSGTGWARLPSGMIIQWGTQGTSGTAAVIFPTTFPNACFVCIACEAEASGWEVSGTLNPTIHAPNGTNSSSTTMVSVVVDSGGATAFAAGSTFSYIAIGF